MVGSDGEATELCEENGDCGISRLGKFELFETGEGVKQLRSSGVPNCISGL